MKEKSQLRSVGCIDLHFHGAFGVDLMRSRPSEMNALSAELWKQGVAGFCATTLSTQRKELLASVKSLGQWIHSRSAPGAQPLGIHLEGPFVSPLACGAHPPDSIRALDFSELEDLWIESKHTLKILTVAPELLKPAQLKKLRAWALPKKIILSAGHSRATRAEAQSAFENGFRGVTHAWNALGFHQREPGVLGAAIGRRGTYLELIIDGEHVSQEVIRWTTQLHPECCFVSDCVPAAATQDGKWHSFGPLKVRYQNGVCRLKGGHLAGGGKLLTQSFIEWAQRESQETGLTLKHCVQKNLPSATSLPLKALGMTLRDVGNRQISWTISSSGKLSFKTIQG